MSENQIALARRVIGLATIQAAGSRDIHGGGHLRIADHRKGSSMSILGIVLLVLLVLLLMGALPRWGHSRNWGYGPSGGLGVILVILLVLVVFRVF